MANRPITERSSKEIATDLFFGPSVDLELKLSHVDDVRVLQELKDLAFQRNRNDILKLAEARLQKIQQ